MSYCRVFLWGAALAAILGFGWAKSVENRQDRNRQTQWRERMDRRAIESRAEFRHLAAWLRELHLQGDARRQVETRLSRTAPVAFRFEGEREVATWTHPEYGTRLEMEFAGDRLVGNRVDGGTGPLLALDPQPPRQALAGPTESIRQAVGDWGGWLWLALLPGAVASRRGGLPLAELLLVIALGVGTAWMVAPLHALSLGGILSNDRLFFAVPMYLVSLVCVALRSAPRMRQDTPLRFRFGVRALLALTAAVAVLVAMGPFGYIALCAFAVGAVVFFGIVASRQRAQAAGRRVA